MEIAATRYFADSEDDSSTGSLSSPRSSFSGSDQRLTLEDALPDWQCKYTGKICPNPRARKNNGKPHRLCEEHRVRANANQRTLQQKRRDARDRMKTNPYPVSPPYVVEPLADDVDDWVAGILKPDCFGFEPLPASLIVGDVAPEPLTSPSELTDEDVEALTLLFTSSISTDSTIDEIYDVMRAIHPDAS